MDKCSFDPDATGVNNGNYFGLPFSVGQSPVVLLSVPWDVTASYGRGAAQAPDAIIGASTQLDLCDSFAAELWQRGIGTIGIDYSIAERSDVLSRDSQKVIEHLEAGGDVSDPRVRNRIERINHHCAELTGYVYDKAREQIAAGKVVGVIGGDHSTPLGAIRAAAEAHGPIGILHLDAHRDLRKCYQGFTESHACIMYNVLERIPQVERLVQVAVRDFCHAEQRLAQDDPRVVSFEDMAMSERLFCGHTWDSECDAIVAALPGKVYISFDIDALSPENCPGSGTPVAGGLTFNQAMWLLQKVATSGRRIVGFDLCEVAPTMEGEWDANVGARVLLKLCTVALRTMGA